MHRIGQKQLEAILIELSSGYFAVDANATVAELDPRIISYGGKPRDEIVGRNVFELFPPLRGSIFEEKIRRVLETQHPERFEAQCVIYVDRWFEVNVVPNFGGAIVIYTDVTARQAAAEALVRNEERLRRSEEWLRTMVNTAPCVLWEAEVQKNAHGYRWSKLSVADETAAQRVMPLEVPAGMTYGEVLLKSRHPHDVEKGETTARRAFALKEPAFTNEYRCQDRFRTEHWQREHVAVRHLNGSLILLTGLVIDVTQHKLADQQLKRLFSESPCIFWEAEVTGLSEWQEPYTGGRQHFDWKVRVHDEQAAQALLPLDVPPGKGYGEVCAAHRLPGEAERNDAAVAHVLQRNEPGLTHEYRCADKFGHVHWLFEQISFKRVALGRWVAAGVTMDVTAQKTVEQELRRAKEEAEQASRAKDRFLATLSHELRTPLNPVMLAVHGWIRDESLPPQLREDLQMIQRNIELEAHFIDDLLDLTSITRGKLQAKFQTVNIHDLVLYVQDIVLADAREKEVTVHTELAAQRPVINTDPARFEQVLWNLLKNAVKFTPRGGEVTVATSDIANGLRVDVIDNGIGIPSEIVPSIFEAFEQGDPRMTVNFGGLGLGLAIAKGIVDLLGGTIEVTSDGPGKGARFSVALPN